MGHEVKERYKGMIRDEIEESRLKLMANISDAEDFVRGTMGFHEALDRTWTVTSMVNQLLLDHPAIVIDSGLYTRVWMIHEELSNLYEALSERNSVLFGEEG